LQKNQEKVLHEKNTVHQYLKNCKEKHTVLWRDKIPGRNGTPPPALHIGGNPKPKIHQHLLKAL
jgi:hypothetical protein